MKYTAFRIALPFIAAALGSLVVIYSPEFHSSFCQVI